MTVAFLVFGVAYFTLCLKPILGAHDPLSISGILLVTCLPVLWVWSMKTRRSVVALVIVPICFLVSPGIQLWTETPPTTAVLYTVVLVMYMLTTGQSLSRSHVIPSVVDTDWVQSTERLPARFNWGVMPIACAVCLGVLCILGGPEWLVPPEHRWAGHRSRVQVFCILALGIHGILILDRLSRRHVYWSGENTRILMTVSVVGLLTGLSLEWVL